MPMIAVTIVVWFFAGVAIGAELNQVLTLARRSLVAHFHQYPLQFEPVVSRLANDGVNLVKVTFRDRGSPELNIDHIQSDGYPIRGRILLKFAENLAAFLQCHQVTLQEASLLRWRRGDRTSPMLHSALLHALRGAPMLSHYEQFGYRYIKEDSHEEMQEAAHDVRACKKLYQMLNEFVYNPGEFYQDLGRFETLLMENGSFPSNAINVLAKPRQMTKNVIPSSSWRCLFCREEHCVRWYNTPKVSLISLVQSFNQPNSMGIPSTAGCDDGFSCTLSWTGPDPSVSSCRQARLTEHT